MFKYVILRFPSSPLFKKHLGKWVFCGFDMLIKLITELLEEKLNKTNLFFQNNVSNKGSNQIQINFIIIHPFQNIYGTCRVSTKITQKVMKRLVNFLISYKTLKLTQSIYEQQSIDKRKLKLLG